LFDAEVAEDEELGGLLDAHLLDPCGWRDFQMLSKPSDESALAESDAAGEAGVGEVFAEVLVDETEELIEAHGLVRGRRMIQFGEGCVQEGGSAVVKPGEGGRS